ncbi:MAG: hypothetical protein R2690_00300 [Acidimicrobiales bacterium]
MPWRTGPRTQRTRAPAAAAAERERRARQHFEFLTSVAQVVMRSASHEELMASVAQATVPMLGDWCTVHFRPEPGAAAGRRCPPRPGAPSGCATWSTPSLRPTGQHGVAPRAGDGHDRRAAPRRRPCRPHLG